MDGNPTDRSSILDTFARGAAKFRDAYAGVTDAELDATPDAGGWTLRQIAFHLAHSDAIGVDRMLRVAFERRPPLLVGYDETSATTPTFADGHPLDELLTLFELNRRAFVRIARRLPADAFERYGIHSEVGKVTLGDQIRKYDAHLDHHLRFVAQKRAGK